MAKQTCAVCDECGRHEEIGGFGAMPVGWYAQVESDRDFTLLCSITCILNMEGI